MQCEDVVLNEPPLSSIYDVKNGKNEVFEKKGTAIRKELKANTSKRLKPIVLINNIDYIHGRNLFIRCFW